MLASRKSSQERPEQFRPDEVRSVAPTTCRSRILLSKPTEAPPGVRLDRYASPDMTRFVRPARKPTLELETFFAPATLARMVKNYKKNQVIFSEGEPASTVFYIRTGWVKFSVVSKQGKEAVVAILGAGDLFGYGCLADEPLRTLRATVVAPCSLLRLERKVIARLLHKHQAFCDQFTSYIISRKIRTLDDWVDRLFNSVEERLARALLLLAGQALGAEAEGVIPKLSQGTLAAMIGATRPRVSVLMNKFKKLGFIEYNGVLKVHPSLLSVLLKDQAASSLKGPPIAKQSTPAICVQQIKAVSHRTDRCSLLL